MLGSGTLLWFANAPAQEQQTVRIAAIQGNIGSADKWDMSAAQCWDIYIGMTEEAAQDGAELIIWPETAVPIVLKNKASYCEELSELAQEYGVSVMVGAFTAGEGGSYNSILTMQPDGSFSDTVYSKRHLVPFGEYVPMKDVIMTLVPALGELSRFVDGLLPGESANVVSTEQGRVGSLICFDSIYEELALDSVRNGAQLLAISTNDSWFFDSAAVHMHSAQAQLRAIETGRCVLRSANTGISSVISARGEILDTLPALCDGVLIGEVALQDNTTLYTRTGNLLVYLCMGFCAAFALVGVVDRCKKTKTRE